MDQAGWLIGQQRAEAGAKSVHPAEIAVFEKAGIARPAGLEEQPEFGEELSPSGVQVLGCGVRPR
jgi:hypothetical protein